jgi:hypothetical protein
MKPRMLTSIAAVALIAAQATPARVAAQEGRMLDLGTLGGTLAFTGALNERGQVVGISTLPGDLTFHPLSACTGFLIP